MRRIEAKRIFVFHFKSFGQRGLNKQLAWTPRAKLTMQSISIIALFGCVCVCVYVRGWMWQRKPYGRHNYTNCGACAFVFAFLHRI